MSILVTGGLGYVGSHAVKMLVEKGEHVISLDNLVFGHEEASSGSDVVIGDIGDRGLLDKIFSKNEIEAVMHFAAFADVGDSVANPRTYYTNNVTNTLTLMEAMLDHDCKMMIFSSTAATFGEPVEVPIPEDHPKKPTNPYGTTKLAIEEALKEYEHAYGLHSISFRYFNASGADPDGTIGEDHDPEHHIIPLVLQVALGQRENIKIFGTDWPTEDGTCVRDYIHVCDLAEAHILGLDSLRNGEKTTAYNLGNGNGYSVSEVIKAAEEITGRSIPAVPSARRPGDPAVLVASSKKAKTELGLTMRYPELEIIIETAWRWHSNNPQGYKGR